MNITKQITVIDKDKVKVGDKIKLDGKHSIESNIVTVEGVYDDSIVVKFDNSIKYKANIETLNKYNIEKVESKTSKFATGQLYRVEDAYSCDKFDVLVMTVSDSEISVIRLKSASAMSIKESEIDTRYKFIKIKTVEECGRLQRECENEEIPKSNSLDKVFETILKELANQPKDNDKPFFSGYKPSFYFKTDTK